MSADSENQKFQLLQQILRAQQQQEVQVQVHHGQSDE
jgi:hypothetical protein